MKIFGIVKKYYEYVITKFSVMIEQKTYNHNGVALKYIYKEENDSDSLVLVFSACTREGLKARYNYVKTLDGMKCNRLYILDDFGPDGRGSYYLGHMPEFKEQEAVIALVEQFVEEKKPGKLFFCGSCKGAYAALNFGSRYKNSTIIIGEPTYRIATEFALKEDLLEYWMGHINQDNIEYMDYHLTNQLENNEFKDSQTIYYYYSAEDEYIDRHTKPLLYDLKRFGYKVYEETCDFQFHADLGYYFSTYLKKKLRENTSDGE